MESGRESGQRTAGREPEAASGSEPAAVREAGQTTGHGTHEDALAAAILGTGIDMVHVPSFAADLARPGSTFAASVFTVGERAAANRRGLTGDALARHLAGRWAVKEAVIKAWSQALYGEPPVIPRDEVDWRDIEVVADAWGRVAVALRGRVGEELPASLAGSGCFATPTSSPEGRPDIGADVGAGSGAGNGADIGADNAAGGASRESTGVAAHISISHDGDNAIAIAILAVR